VGLLCGCRLLTLSMGLRSTIPPSSRASSSCWPTYTCRSPFALAVQLGNTLPAQQMAADRHNGLWGDYRCLSNSYQASAGCCSAIITHICQHGLIWCDTPGTKLCTAGFTHRRGLGSPSKPSLMLPPPLSNTTTCGWCPPYIWTPPAAAAAQRCWQCCAAQCCSSPGCMRGAVLQGMFCALSYVWR
jgi:hypothetical protein